MRTLFWLLFSLLVLVRVPSLVQPAGGDQGLYAYIGERILAGEVPYRDAWDQKPPGIHYTYALMYAMRPDLSVVPAADLVVAAASALLVFALGRRLGPPGSGELAALLFLLYTNPALARLGGARVRAQCEVFIAFFASGGLLLVHIAATRLQHASRAWAQEEDEKNAGAIESRHRSHASGARRHVEENEKGMYSLSPGEGRENETLAPQARGAEAAHARGATPLSSGEGVSDDRSERRTRGAQRARRAAGAKARAAASVVTLAIAALAGVCFGVAFVYKYNAGIYLLVGLAALWIWARARLMALLPSALWIIVGFAAMFALLVGYFASVGALQDLYDATIAYNVFYSGETYRSRLDVLRYLLTFPIGRARVEALWFLGGLGCLTLIAVSLNAWLRPKRESAHEHQHEHPLQHQHEHPHPHPHPREREREHEHEQEREQERERERQRGRERKRDGQLTHLVPVLWVAASCISIAVNGSRGLPQYFLQAGPALALAAGIAGALAWHSLNGTRQRSILLVTIALIAIGAWRVQDFDKGVDYTLYDLRYWRGELTREQYLSRFGNLEAGDKYSALAVDELARYLSANVPPSERVLHFGFSQGALAQSRRVSATRFFWSRPIIVGFKEGTPGYGPTGLLQEITRTKPYEVILQRRDWDPDTLDSATFFLQQPALSAWLRAHYQPAREMGNFLLYRRANGAPATAMTPGSAITPGSTIRPGSTITPGPMITPRSISAPAAPTPAPTPADSGS